MYIYKSEWLAFMAIFGTLWAVIPWSPLSYGEGILAGFYLVIITFGIIALLEMVIEHVMDEIRKEER